MTFFFYYILVSDQYSVLANTGVVLEHFDLAAQAKYDSQPLLLLLLLFYRFPHGNLSCKSERTEYDVSVSTKIFAFLFTR